MDLVMLARARGLTPTDPGVGECWTLVVRGIEAGWLDEETLGEVIQALDAGTDLGFQELSFDHLGGVLRVSFLDDEARCSPAAMRQALAALLGPPSNGGSGP
jgi:hypothetical protein